MLEAFLELLSWIAYLFSGIALKQQSATVLSSVISDNCEIIVYAKSLYVTGYFPYFLNLLFSYSPTLVKLKAILSCYNLRIYICFKFVRAFFLYIYFFFPPFPTSDTFHSSGKFT